MKLFPFLSASVFLSLALFSSPRAEAESPQATVLDKETLQPFLENYCIRCHGPEKQKGQLRFDQSDWEITDNDTAQRWQDVLDQLNGGDMPPEDEEQPTTDELSAILDTLTGSVLNARKRLTDHGGEIKMRRLNKREYSNTIRDLFGFDIPLSDIPDDGEIDTFDTVGQEQYFTSAHFEKYLELGSKVASTALDVNTRPHAKRETKREQPEEKITGKMREKLADSDRKKAMKEAGKTWREMGFKDEGAMGILFKQWDSRVELPRRYLQYPLVDTGIYNCDVAKSANVNKHIDIRGDYLIHVHGGVVGDPHELRRIIRLSDRNRIHGTLKMTGTPETPETVTLRTRNLMGARQLSINVRENQPDDTINTMRGYLNKLKHTGHHTDPRAALWFDWLAIEGPIYPEQRPKFEDLLYPEKPSGGQSPLVSKGEQAREFIERFATLAFRRKTPEPKYLDALLANYREIRATGLNHRKAIAEIMGIILASPSFLFIEEAVPAQDSPHGFLDSRELAIRLSYFLWSCPPDDELYDSDLTDSAVYAQQVDRLLADPKAQAFRDGFIGQWVEFDRYDAITVDRKEHFQFNQGVQQDAKQEVREFFGALIEDNLPAANLIDSDFVMINGALATHYGLEFDNPGNDQFQKVVVPAESHRGGLLTQAAFLTTGSNGERSSPVIRGALVMEKILHDKPAPPPPNVPELDEASDKPMSNRELVILHQNRATCASCHRKMDVIGFGLENFDTIGRWRDTERVGRKDVPIQPGGTLPGGKAFVDVTELKALLIGNQNHLGKELVESMLAYALGRTIEFSDADHVEKILSKLKPNNYPVRDIIREVALSALFKKK